MQEPITLNVSPFQAMLALAFQIWIVVFPILILRKINHLTNIIEDRFGEPSQEDSVSEDQDRNEGV